MPSGGNATVLIADGERALACAIQSKLRNPRDSDVKGFFRVCDDRYFMRSSVPLAVMILLFGAPGCAQKGLANWYGHEIGELPEAGARDRIRFDPEGTLLVAPPPWRAATGVADADGRISELNFYDPCCDSDPDMPPGYVAGRFRSPEQLLADGKAALAYAVARLGKPTKIDRVGSPADHGLRINWDFRSHFVRCKGATPIFAAPSHEPSDRIALVTLVIEPQEVRLSVSGRNARSVEETMPLAGENEGDAISINERQLRDAREECQASDRPDGQPAR